MGLLDWFFIAVLNDSPNLTKNFESQLLRVFKKEIKKYIAGIWYDMYLKYLLAFLKKMHLGLIAEL